jgi:dipeptidyl-peptidase 4
MGRMPLDESTGPTTGSTIAGLPYPRLAARTQNFRLGAPRSFIVSRDGQRVVFVRSAGPADRVNRLFVLDLDTGVERLVADPLQILGGGQEDLSAAERARRERQRETTAGITTFSTDRDARWATFALSGSLHVVDLVQSADRITLDVPGPVVDPRMSPDAHHIAFSASGGIHAVTVATGEVRTLAEPESATVSYGIANFVAAEELARHRGHWWSPDSDAILVERVDNAPVKTWWIGDPSNPDATPTEHRYPQSGTANPEVSLVILRLDGQQIDVRWDNTGFEYLVTAGWQAEHEPLITVMSRDQRRQQVLEVNSTNGKTHVLHEQSDDCWVEWVPGLPCWAGSTLLVHRDDMANDTRAIVTVLKGDERSLTPVGLQIDSVLAADSDALVITATKDPTTMDVLRVTLDGQITTVAGGDDRWRTAVCSSATPGAPIVLGSMGLDTTATDWSVHRDGQRIDIVSHQAGPQQAQPPVNPAVRILSLTDRQLRTAVLLPHDHVPGTPLPVVMSPYGGPHHLEVLAAARLFSEDQFIADQGFAVVIVDGRGTPHRGPRFARAIKNDVAGPILQDQVDALQAAAQQFPDLDLTRVGIRGWSFGGYLSALAVMDRPDVFHAAVAGAPVTDWRLYDTGYTERYLDDPSTNAVAYEAADLTPRASKLTRPLMIIHGLADDNVIAAHSVRLSGALLAAGKPHTFLPLSGVTHMTPQEIVSENLLKLQIEFLREHLHVS